MQYLTSQWSRLHEAATGSVYVLSFMAEVPGNYTPDDILAAAISGFEGEILSATVSRGSPVQVRIRFAAADQAEADLVGEAAAREAGRASGWVDSIKVTRGRRLPGER